MTGKRVIVHTITFKDYRVESFRSLVEGQGSALVREPDDAGERAIWKLNGIIGRRYPWRDIDHIDQYFNVIECTDEEPCWGADCERCQGRAEEADILVHADGRFVGDPRPEQEQVYREITR